MRRTDAALLACSVSRMTFTTFLGFIATSAAMLDGHPSLNRRTRVIACGQTLRRSRRNCDSGCISPCPEQGRWLAQVTSGYFAYHAVPTNFASTACRLSPCQRILWLRTLQRRQPRRIARRGSGSRSFAADFLPQPTTLHPWPNMRFAVTHPRCCSRVREFRSRGSVRAGGNGRPYREPFERAPATSAVHLKADIRLHRNI